MKKKERKTLCRYIRWVANELELRDWTIELLRAPAPADSLGYVHITYGRKLAEIRLSSDFRTRHPEDQRHTIVHELVHCHLESAHNMIFNDLEEFLGKQTDQVFYNGFKRQVEYGVDALASAIAKRLPVIDWDNT